MSSDAIFSHWPLLKKLKVQTCTDSKLQYKINAFKLLLQIIFHKYDGVISQHV
jgi:hypothetical protein